jgi:hypothetical protein
VCGWVGALDSGNGGNFQEEEERRRTVKEVAYNLNQRIRQELAHPAVIHFYVWLLQGAHLTAFGMRLEFADSFVVPQSPPSCGLHAPCATRPAFWKCSGPRLLHFHSRPALYKETLPLRDNSSRKVG